MDLNFQIPITGSKTGRSPRFDQKCTDPNSPQINQYPISND